MILTPYEDKSDGNTQHTSQLVFVKDRREETCFWPANRSAVTRRRKRNSELQCCYKIKRWEARTKSFPQLLYSGQASALIRGGMGWSRSFTTGALLPGFCDARLQRTAMGAPHELPQVWIIELQTCPSFFTHPFSCAPPRACDIRHAPLREIPDGARWFNPNHFSIQLLENVPRQLHAFASTQIQIRPSHFDIADGIRNVGPKRVPIQVDNVPVGCPRAPVTPWHLAMLQEAMCSLKLHRTTRAGARRNTITSSSSSSSSSSSASSYCDISVSDGCVWAQHLRKRKWEPE